MLAPPHHSWPCTYSLLIFIGTFESVLMRLFLALTGIPENLEAEVCRSVESAFINRCQS